MEFNTVVCKTSKTYIDQHFLYRYYNYNYNSLQSWPCLMFYWYRPQRSSGITKHLAATCGVEANCMALDQLCKRYVYWRLYHPKVIGHCRWSAAKKTLHWTQRSLRCGWLCSSMVQWKWNLTNATKPKLAYYKQEESSMPLGVTMDHQVKSNGHVTEAISKTR